MKPGVIGDKRPGSPSHGENYGRSVGLSKDNGLALKLLCSFVGEWCTKVPIVASRKTFAVLQLTLPVFRLTMRGIHGFQKRHPE